MGGAFLVGQLSSNLIGKDARTVHIFCSLNYLEAKSAGGCRCRQALETSGRFVHS